MSTEPDTPSVDSPTDREEMMELLEDAIRESHRKVESGRVYDAKNEKVRIQWIRCLAYSVGQYRQLKKDEQLDELEERLAAVEEQQGADR